MERLVFNTAEHKLEELEKYGFAKESEQYLEQYCKKYKNSDFTISINTHSKIVYIECETNDYSFTTKLCVLLYDLIKDGLVVKEKKDECSHCN